MFLVKLKLNKNCYICQEIINVSNDLETQIESREDCNTYLYCNTTFLYVFAVKPNRSVIHASCYLVANTEIVATRQFTIYPSVEQKYYITYRYITT